MVVMPNDVLARQDQAEQWAPVQAAYEASVSEIMSYENDPRVSEWLATATKQFVARAIQIGKGAQAAKLAAIVKDQSRLRKGAGVVTINKQEHSMNTSYEQFCQLVEVEILKSEADGKRLSFGDAAAVVNRQHQGLYAAAVKSAPAVERREPEPMHVMKSTTSGDILLMFARQKLIDGEAKSLGEAIGKVHAAHPSLYRQYREGK